MYSAARRYGLGSAESDFNDAGDPAGPTPWVLAIRAIRSVSVPMGQLRQRITAALANVANADSDVDVDQLMRDIQQMQSYAQQLPALIAAAKQLPEYVTDARTAAELNNWLAFLQDWAGSTFSAIGALPTDVANYLGGQIAGIGKAAGDALSGTVWSLAKVFVPIAIVLGGAIWLTRQAERTQTGRALARRL